MKPPIIEYQDRALIYLDVLGWSDLVRRSVNDPVAKQCVEKTAHQLTTFGSTHQALEHANPVAYEAELGVYITQASDSLMISCRPTVGDLHGVLDHLGSLCTVLLVRGNCYLRGALVRGALFHRTDADRGLIVGPALVDAVAIEKAACYPRILISPEALSLVPDGWVREDASDGAPYLDFLRWSAEEQQVRRDCDAALAIVQTKLEGESTTPALRLKHEWMKRYLESVLADLQ